MRAELPGVALDLHTGAVAADDVLTLNGRVVLLGEQARERAGLTEPTWSSWRTRGWPRGNPVPDPDGWIDRRTPVWWPETIDEWVARRPGK